MSRPTRLSSKDDLYNEVYDEVHADRNVREHDPVERRSSVLDPTPVSANLPASSRGRASTRTRSFDAPFRKGEFSWKKKIVTGSQWLLVPSTISSASTTARARTDPTSVRAMRRRWVLVSTELALRARPPTPLTHSRYALRSFVRQGGISPSAGGMAAFADVSTVSSLYASMAVPGVRPNDLGGPFDLRCMFPIANVSDIPPADSTFEDIRSDPRWNFTASDEVFADLLENGFAPYLKLASREWTSGLSTGFSYVGEDGVPVYVVPPQDIGGFCSDWPYIAPVMESIGDQLILTIVERYNNESMWSERMAGSLEGPPLEAATWASVTGATVGVELQNGGSRCYDDDRCCCSTPSLTRSLPHARVQPAAVPVDRHRRYHVIRGMGGKLWGCAVRVRCQVLGRHARGSAQVVRVAGARDQDAVPERARRRTRDWHWRIVWVPRRTGEHAGGRRRV